MDKIKKGLGRGLSSLIGETKDRGKKKSGIYIRFSSKPISTSRKILMMKFNLKDLTNSIKERGMIQPIIVRKS